MAFIIDDIIAALLASKGAAATTAAATTAAETAAATTAATAAAATAAETAAAAEAAAAAVTGTATTAAEATTLFETAGASELVANVGREGIRAGAQASFGIEPGLLDALGESAVTGTFDSGLAAGLPAAPESLLPSLAANPPTFGQQLASLGGRVAKGAARNAILGAATNPHDRGRGALAGAAIGGLGGGFGAFRQAGGLGADLASQASLGVEPQTFLQGAGDALIGEDPLGVLLGTAKIGTRRGALPQLGGRLKVNAGPKGREVGIRPFGNSGVTRFLLQDPNERLRKFVPEGFSNLIFGGR